MKKINFAILTAIFMTMFATNILLADENITYGTAFALFQSKNYEEASNEFAYLIENDKIDTIGDYIFYYHARSKMNLEEYDEAYSSFNKVVNGYKNSLLVALARQYMTLSKFIIDDYPVDTLVASKEAGWMKKYILVKALADMSKIENKDKASHIAKILVEQHDSIEGASYYDKQYRQEITDKKDLAMMIKLARIFYTSAHNNSAFYYFTILLNESRYKEESIYKLANVHERKKERDKAIELYAQYVDNTNYNTYRNNSLFSLAEQSYLSRKYADSTEIYLQYIKEYPKKSNYLLRSYRRLVVNYLRSNNFDAVKPYIDYLYETYPDESMTDIALRNYIRKTLLSGKQEETYATIDKFRKMYTTANRIGYGLSWDRWASLQFDDTNKAMNAVQQTLLYSKNPHHLQEAYTIATDEMKELVSYSNTIYFEQAKSYHAKGNKDMAYDRLNRIQFNDAIMSLKETEFLTEVRDFAKSIMLEHKFVKDYYSNKQESEIIEDLSKYTKKASDKAVLLYQYKDYENAHNELKAVNKNYAMTFDMFYMYEKILTSGGDVHAFFNLSNRIGQYFGYKYYHNVELLPDEMRRYAYPRYYDQYVVPEANHYKLNPSFVYAIMREESTFRDYVYSWVGAVGLMQLMPATGAMENKNKRYGYDPLVLTNAEQNINLGVGHLDRLFKDNPNNYIIVCAKYNAGTKNALMWADAYGTNDMNYYARLITFEETEHYVQKVMASFNFYERFY